MELLVWHEALGSDDEQATEQERLARLLYAHSKDGERGEPTDVAQARGMHTLQFMEALVAITRLLRRQRATTSASPHWISMLLRKRRFYICEMEPQIFFALGLENESLCGSDLRLVHQAVVQEVYDSVRLFYGRIEAQLQDLPAQLSQQFNDGLALLCRIGAVRRRLRKIEIALELDDHDSSVQADRDDMARRVIEEESAQLNSELDALELVSPSRRLWQRCESLIPKLLRLMEVQRLNMFHEVGGVAYFPMDESTFLSFQTLINTLHADLQGIISGGFACFYKGNLLWRTMDAHTLRLLQHFLRLRELDGMDVESNRTQTPHTPSALWMRHKYDDAFLPVWASKTTYAECAVVTHILRRPRHAARSVHKVSPSSLSALINEASDGTNDKTMTHEQNRIRHGQRYRSDAPVYRNRGFLTRSGYFLPSWELAKADSQDVVWAPSVFSHEDGGLDVQSAALLYHENDLSVLVLAEPMSTATAVLQHMERIENCLEKLQFASMATTIWQRYQAMTGSSPSREKGVTSQPLHVYLDRVNLAFNTSEQIPRLIKCKEADLFPRPAYLWGNYFPDSSLQLLNDAHALLNGDPDSLEVRVKTVSDGWLVASRSRASDRELYALLDTKTASVVDAQDAVADLVTTQFSNNFI